MTELPSSAQVVVVGGGVIGCSTAYHLTKAGVTDVLVLEQGRLSGGTTWHAAGLVGPLRATESGTRLVQYSAELYARLEQETGLATGYRNVGGLVVARSEDRMVALRRTAANAAAYDLPCRLLSPDEAGEMWPPMRVDDLRGALHLPGDGKVNPTDLTQSLAKGARMGGARVVEGVRVTGFAVSDGVSGARVTGVRTDHGDVDADVVVNCGGMWAHALGRQAGVTVPLHAAEHFYVVTEAIEGVHPDLPIMRDPDGWTYFKEEVGGLVVGGFEPDAKPWKGPDDVPYPFEFQLLDEDWEHFSTLMDEALRRVPALEETGIRKFYNGPESFTPDNQFLLGEAPGVRGYFVGAGFNSVGIASAGGAGRALAEWIVAGEPQEDLVAVDVRRFAPFQNDIGWLRSRVAEVLGLHYAIPWPDREMTSGRDQRRSPLHDRLAGRGAWFGTRMGWERPNVFTQHDPGASHTWGRPAWLDDCAREQRSCRTEVAVFDQTSFSKYAVSGVGALASLQWICAADVDVAVGRCVYTPWLNSRGTYEADLTVTRTAADEFLVISSSASTVRDLDWLRRHVGPVTIVDDLTDDYSVLGVMGPASRDLLGRLTDDDLSDDGFAFTSSRPLDLAGVRVRATRMTYVGEVGWELLVPWAGVERVYEAVMGAGPAVDAGYLAIEALRLEKGYRAFGRELTPDYTPLEAGLVFATALRDSKDFLGRRALEERQRELEAGGPRRRLVSLVVADPGQMLWGGELLSRDGDPVGQVTSAAWGASVGSAVGLGYVRADGPVGADWLRAADHTVDVAGHAVPVTLTMRAPH